jgi:nucleoside-diphosphate-sugar epimerase
MSADARSCLVIGAHGFVGSALASEARARGWAVTDGTRERLDALTGQRFDLVINANGNARKYLARRDPDFDYRATVESVQRSLRAFPCDRYLLISSVDVYPTPARVDTTHEDAAIAPANLDTYGRHKLLAEQAVIEGASAWLIVRLGQMLGPGLAKGPIFDLLHGRPLWVDPDSRYPFLRTDKVATIAVALAMSHTNQRFNVCGRSSASVREAIAALGLPEPGVDRSGALAPALDRAKPRERYAIDTRKLEASYPGPLPRSSDELQAFLADPHEGLRA